MAADTKTEQKCQINKPAEIKDYGQRCLRGSLSKSLICRIFSTEKYHWINILSQITIDNELTPSLKKVILKAINNLDVDSDDTINVNDLITQHIGNRVTFIMDMLANTFKKGMTLNSGFTSGDLKICKSNIDELSKQLNIQLNTLNNELSKSESNYSLKDLLKIFSIIFNYVEIVFEITSSIGYGKESGSLLKASTYLNKFINWKITPCIHRMYYLFYKYSKLYGLKIKLLTPDCQNTIEKDEENLKKRKLELGKCRTIDVSSENMKVQHLLISEEQVGGLNNCERINSICKELNLENNEHDECIINKCSLSTGKLDDTGKKIDCKIFPVQVFTEPESESQSIRLRKLKHLCKAVNSEDYEYEIKMINQEGIEDSFYKTLIEKGWDEVIMEINNKINSDRKTRVENTIKLHINKKEIDQKLKNEIKQEQREKKLQKATREDAREAIGKAEKVAREELQKAVKKEEKAANKAIAKASIRAEKATKKAAREAAKEAIAKASIRAEKATKKAAEKAGEAAEKAREAAEKAKKAVEKAEKNFIESKINNIDISKNFAELKSALDIKFEELIQNYMPEYESDYKIITKFRGYVNKIAQFLDNLKPLLYPSELKIDELMNEFGEFHEDITINLKENKIPKKYVEIDREINEFSQQFKLEKKTLTDEQHKKILDTEKRKKIILIIENSLNNLNYNLTLIEANTLYKNDVEKLCQANKCYIDCKSKSQSKIIHDETFITEVIKDIKKENNHDNSIVKHMLEQPEVTKFISEIEFDNHVSEHVQDLLKSLLVTGIAPTEWDKISRNNNPETPYLESKNYWQRPKISEHVDDADIGDFSDADSVMWESWPMIPNLIFNIKKYNIKPQITNVEYQLNNMNIFDDIIDKIVLLLRNLRSVIDIKMKDYESDHVRYKNEIYKIDIQEISSEQSRQIKKIIEETIEETIIIENKEIKINIWNYIFDRKNGVLVKLYKKKGHDFIPWDLYQPSPHDVANACLHYNKKFVESCKTNAILIVHIENDKSAKLNQIEPKWGSDAHMQSVGMAIDGRIHPDIVYQEAIQDDTISVGKIIHSINSAAESLGFEGMSLADFTAKIIEFNIEIHKFLYELYIHEISDDNIQTIQVDFLAKIVSLLIDLIKHISDINQKLNNFINLLKGKSNQDGAGLFDTIFSAVADMKTRVIINIEGSIKSVKNELRAIIEPIYKVVNIYCKPYGINIPLLDELKEISV